MAIIHERVMEFMNKLADLGAKWVEFDIKLTSDLQPVLFHDTSVKITEMIDAYHLTRTTAQSVRN